MLSPTGVVKTTTNQTVSGEKNFKSTLTVEASSYFEDTVTIGDVNQPKIFDVCSTNGTTTVNIANLPVSSNGLNPGDLYVTEIDGKKILGIVKPIESDGQEQKTRDTKQMSHGSPG